MTAAAHPAQVRWRVVLLAALTVVLGLLLPALPASAVTLPAAETRVGVSGPATAVAVGVHECITAGQRPVRGPSQLQIVVGNCVAAEAGGSSRLRTMRADPERGSIGGQWPSPTASNCRQCADEIQRLIGVQQAVIGPAGSGRVLGPSTNNPAGDWFEHVAVVKDGRAYDGFTGRAGMSIDEFKAQFEYGDAINFGF